jgi:hypothetical protein
MTDPYNPDPGPTGQPDDASPDNMPSEAPAQESWLADASEKAAVIAGIIAVVALVCCCGGLIVNYLIAQG